LIQSEAPMAGMQRIFKVSPASVITGFDAGEDLASGIVIVEEATALEHLGEGAFGRRRCLTGYLDRCGR
jgi:hypothetical protein